MSFSPHEVEARSGRYVDLSGPQPESIALEDITYALGRICRYGGHCDPFYSVAEHAVFVSRRLERQGHSRLVQLIGLHHDDAEAYLGDVPRPLKGLLQPAYGALNDKMETAIAMALNLPQGDPLDRAEIKVADNWALFVEAKHLLPSRGRGWSAGLRGSQPSRIVTPDYWRGGLAPHAATALYAARHWSLTSKSPPATLPAGR